MGDVLEVSAAYAGRQPAAAAHIKGANIFLNARIMATPNWR